MAKSGWHRRGLTSLLTLAGFLVMSITGLVLYIVPQGRVAYWTVWKLAGLTKTQWDNIHILSSLLFIVAGAFHLYFNWKPLLNYLRDKVQGGVRLKKELGLTAAGLVLVTVSAIWSLPPLSYLLDLNAAVKEAWVKDKDYEPPFGHAELLSFKVFCKKTDIPLDKAKAELEARGLKGIDEARTLEEIARENRISPLEIYRMIKKLEVLEPVQAPAGFTAESVEEIFAGTGIGNKTLAEICAKVGLDPGPVKARLEAKGLKVEEDKSIKSLAGLNNLAPLDLLKAALVEDYRPAR